MLMISDDFERTFRYRKEASKGNISMSVVCQSYQQRFTPKSTARWRLIRLRYTTLLNLLLLLFLLTITYNPEGGKKLKSKYKIGYDHQSVQSVAGILSCKSTALKRCTKIEILWYRKLVSGLSSLARVLLLLLLLLLAANKYSVGGSPSAAVDHVHLIAISSRT